MCIFYAFHSLRNTRFTFKRFVQSSLWDSCCENFVFTLAVICWSNLSNVIFSGLIILTGTTGRIHPSWSLWIWYAHFYRYTNVLSQLTSDLPIQNVDAVLVFPVDFGWFKSFAVVEIGQCNYRVRVLCNSIKDCWLEVLWPSHGCSKEFL